MRKTTVIPNGVDVERFRPDLDGDVVRERHGLEDADLILHVGRVAPEKGIEFLLEAFPSLLRRKPGAKLLIVGKGPAQEEYIRYVERKGLGDQVIFSGFVPDEELPLYYAAADAFTTASAFETQGLTVLEAMACGKPVAAVDHRPFPEYIEDGVNGYLFSLGSSEGFCDAVGSALEAEGDLRSRARHTAEKFSVETCTRRLLDLYEDMLPKTMDE